MVQGDRYPSGSGRNAILVTSEFHTTWTPEIGGGGGIRTHGGRETSPVFKTGTFSRTLSPHHLGTLEGPSTIIKPADSTRVIYRILINAPKIARPRAVASELRYIQELHQLSRQPSLRAPSGNDIGHRITRYQTRNKQIKTPKPHRAW